MSQSVSEPLQEDKERDAPPLSHDEAAERVRALLSECRSEEPILEGREEKLEELVGLHERFVGDERELARDAAFAFLLLLRDDPEILENQRLRDFVAHKVSDVDLDRLRWESVEEIIRVAEAFYAFRFRDQLSPEEVTERVRRIVRNALRQFEQQNEPEKMFQLLERAPIPAAMMDPELVRLRNRLHLYEMRRVQRKRHWLYYYLLVQALLVMIVFPLLFQNFENRRIQRTIEETTGIELVEGKVTFTDEFEGDRDPKPYQRVSLPDSIYWSVITYGSIGYGDVRPVTDEGKVLAGLHGIMGVLTTGIVAGLILRWITPRELH